MQNSEKRLENYFARRFAIDEEYWKQFKIFERGSSIWITSRDVNLRDQHVASGIRALRTGGKWVKPTTYILQFLGEKINRNVVELDSEEFKTLLSKRKILKNNLNPGYVALKFRDNILGCGLMVSRALKSRIPKSRMNVLRNIFDITKN